MSAARRGTWRSPADLRDGRVLNLSCGFSGDFRGLAFVFIRRTIHRRSVPRTSQRSMATLGEDKRICTRRLHATRSSLTMETRGFFAIAFQRSARLVRVRLWKDILKIKGGRRFPSDKFVPQHLVK